MNDTHGHAVGDAVLRKLTKEIAKCLRRETDWCARLGGDEFAVVLEGTKISEARICAEKVRQAIEAAGVDTPAGSIRFTVSIGAAGCGEGVGRNAVTMQSLVEQADANLYTSKANGRNCVTPNLGDVSASARNLGRHIQWTNHDNPKIAISSVR